MCAGPGTVFRHGSVGPTDGSARVRVVGIEALGGAFSTRGQPRRSAAISARSGLGR